MRVRGGRANGATVRSHAWFSGASTDRSDWEPDCRRRKISTLPPDPDREGDRGRDTRQFRVIHQRLQHGRTESSVELASERRGGYVEAGAHFSLSEAVHKLRNVMCQMP